MSRQVWSTRTAFLLAAIGSAVGLGNLWRFPYIAYENGGGAFLVPYFIALLTAGIPLLLAEYALGKRSKAGAPHALRDISKKVEWIGWWSVLTGFVILTYYMAVMAWSWVYLAKSFTLPWADDAKGFFFGDVLKISSGPMELGGLVWPLVFGAILTWIIIYFIVRNGTESVAKVVKWTVPLPYLLLLILLGHGLSRDGALEGIIYYLTPNWELLSNPQVWMAAYGQVFFSLSLGFGIMIAYASYLKDKEDLPWQANVAALANSATEFFAGFVVFAVLGALAAVTSVDISEVVASGPGLAFVAFPAALAALPGAKFFSFLFFLMLLTLGIDSAFSLLEAAATALQDRYPNMKRKKILMGLCLVGGAISILFVTNAGLYWLDIVDHWMNAYGLVGIGLAEALIIGIILGTRKMKDELNQHTIRPVGLLWEYSVKLITPIALIITIILSLQVEFSAPYEGYPMKALVLGGWLVWSATIIIAMLLQKDEAKWWKLIGFASIAAIVIIGQMHSAALAMGLFGTLVLGGGLIWLFMLDKKKKLT